MNLFISYAHADALVVKDLATLFEKGNHTPWYDVKLLPGQDWQDVLRKTIEKCDAFVYVLSPASVASTWCSWEFSLAVSLGKPVLPVMIQPTMLPAPLNKLQYADFTRGPTVDNTAQLMGGLAEIMHNIPKQQAPMPPTPHGIPPQGSNAASMGQASPTSSIPRLVKQAAGVAVILIGLLFAGLALPSSCRQDILQCLFNPTRSDGNAGPTSQPTAISPGGASTPAQVITSKAGSQCYGNYAKPEPGFIPSVAKAGPLGNQVLFPIPVDDAKIVGNPGFYTPISDNSILYVIARVPASFGQWLYIELRQDNKLNEYGFVRLGNTDYSGNYDALSEITIPLCKR